MHKHQDAKLEEFILSRDNLRRAVVVQLVVGLRSEGEEEDNTVNPGTLEPLELNPKP